MRFLVKQVDSVKEITDITDNHLDYFTFDVPEWLSHKLNLALRSDDNIAFGEYKSPGTYWVHFCYNSARGRTAIELTKELLKGLYELRDVKTAIGLISVDNKKARWLIRQVGFKSLGIHDTKNGPCEMFYHLNNKDKI